MSISLNFTTTKTEDEMTKYAKLKTEHDNLANAIRAYNLRANDYNVRRCPCPDNCHLRGLPHSHTLPQVPLIRWWYPDAP